MRKIEKINLDEYGEFVTDRFRWDDDYDLGVALRRIESKLNEIIERVNEE